MKRLIKFWQTYENEGIKFSDCSTNYELLPETVDDDADARDLKQLAEFYGINTKGKVLHGDSTYKHRDLFITHAFKTTELKEQSGYCRDNKQLQVFIGFITIPESYYLEIKDTIDNEMSEAEAKGLGDSGQHGIYNYGETVDRGIIMVKSGWNYLHEIPIMGYSLKAFEELLGITEHGFHDDTFKCDKCDLYDSRDNGYEYNYRIVDGERLGTNCGCFDDYNKSDDAIEFYTNNTDNPMSLTSAEKHAEEGRLKFIERFIGGMVDGRGGRWNGEYCREGTPEKCLEEYKRIYPSSDFIFTLDESGQFQSYFSIWKVV